MTYLLHVSASPQGDNSKSLEVAKAFVAAYEAKHVDSKTIHKDLAANPLSHLDGETIFAGYLPEEARSEVQKQKHQLRLDLIKEISEAKDILVSTPMWNWGPPSVLKAYIDQIVLIGALDPYEKKNLAGKSVTVVIACGGAYGPGSWHPEWDFLSGYLTTIFTNLGSTNVQIVRTEYTLAGVVPGMEALVPQKEQSLVDAVTAVKDRVATL
jgi:FMN-dependent NADH-azoreductase